MTAALALPLALVLGIVAAVVSGAVRRLGRRERSWWPDLMGVGRDARLLLRGGKERPTPLELGGALASLFGSALAAAAALGEVPGTVGLVYLTLLAAAAGAHVAALDATTALRQEVGERGRRVWAVAEPGFLLALVVAMARWRATDLDAVRGAQEVLGAGPTVGPALAAVGLTVAVAAFLVTGALRTVPPSEGVRATGRRAGGALVIAVSRWCLAGATALVAAVLLVGGGLRAPAGAPQAWALSVLVAGASAVMLGAVEGAASVFAGRKVLVASVALLATAGAAAAVALG